MALKGQKDNDLLNLLKFGSIASILAVLGVVGFTVLSFFTVPFAVSVISTSLFSGSMVYLMGMSYGILNDILAANKNLPYFLLGHQRQQKSMIESNKVAAVGIAWGIAAVAPLAKIAAIAFSITTLVAGFFVPIALFVLPVMAMAIPVVVLIAHFHAQRKEKEMIDDPSSYAHWSWDFFNLNEYQREGLKFMSDSVEEKAAWFSNSDRNVIGFTYMPILALASLVALVTLSALSAHLPAILFGTLLSTTIPIVFAAVIATGVTGSLIYLALNHNVQEENKFKLDFEPSVEPPATPQADMAAEPGYSWTLCKSKEKQVTTAKVNSSHSSDYNMVSSLRTSGGSPLHQKAKQDESTIAIESGNILNNN